MLLSTSTDEECAGWVPAGRMEILLISDGQTAARSAARRGWAGGFLQEADKTLLFFKILLLQHGTREHLCLKCGYALCLPCVLMHELLANLALAISDNEIQIGKEHGCNLGQAMLCS